MARERLITRTITVSDYTVLALDTVNMTAVSLKVSIPSGDALTDKAREQAIREQLPTDLRYVEHTEAGYTDFLYGMTEEDFMRFGHVLPARGKAE